MGSGASPARAGTVWGDADAASRRQRRLPALLDQNLPGSRAGTSHLLHGGLRAPGWQSHFPPTGPCVITNQTLSCNTPVSFQRCFLRRRQLPPLQTEPGVALLTLRALSPALVLDLALLHPSGRRSPRHKLPESRESCTFSSQLRQCNSIIPLPAVRCCHRSRFPKARSSHPPAPLPKAERFVLKSKPPTSPVPHTVIVPWEKPSPQPAPAFMDTSSIS